ncbi:MAG TPA: OmpH family outer membrane protein, partial [Cytophagales bacterium]
MKKAQITLLIAGLAVLIAAATTWTHLKPRRIAYVRSAVLLEKYAGMKEVEGLYQRKVDQWKTRIDTLERSYQQSVQAYDQQYTRLTAIEKQRQEQTLRQAQQRLDAYAQNVEKEALETREKMMQGAMNQINAYVKEYAREAGIDIVLGVTV